MNCSETNVGKVQEVWDEAEYENAMGTKRRKGVERETNWKKVYNKSMHAEDKNANLFCCSKKVNDVLLYKVKTRSKDPISLNMKIVNKEEC